MEEEVCLLDTRSTPRRQGNRQRTLGRTIGPPSSPRMGSAAAADEPCEVTAAVSFFYHSTPGPYSYAWEQSGIYNRFDCSVLGDSSENVDNALSQDTSRCFNCGDSEHKLPACSLPLNRDLISLSRQYHQFFHGNSPQWKRLHVTESWRQQRLTWLEEFEPGEIRGQLLQSALTESNEEWLKNICAWGYPPGWVDKVDPRERVRDRIWSEDDFDKDFLDEITLLEIHGEEHTIEHISLHTTAHFTHDDDKNRSGNMNNIIQARQSDRVSTDGHLSVDSHTDIPTRRWAVYPNSYFSSEFLFQYSKVNPPTPPSWDDTSFPDTVAYLNQFHVQYHSSPASLSRDYRPPPPQEAPPPLPPPLPSSLFPPGPSSLLSSRIPGSPIHSLDEVESDMELSDEA